MKFNRHLELEGQHAILSASKYHWVNYDENKMAEAFLRNQATLRGTELHDLAARCIRLGVSLPRSKMTLNMYVNDAIGFRMTPEQPLYYSPNCFGTADAICYRNGKLRIHDLKTGQNPASIIQLKIYAALFFLEYGEKPEKTKIELRLYQNNQIESCEPSAKEVLDIMKKVVAFDRLINKMKSEGEIDVQPSTSGPDPVDL